VALDGSSLAITGFGLKLNSLVGVVSVGAPTAANDNGMALTGAVFSSTPADATHPGHITTASQTIAGVKTFSDGIISSSGATADSLESGTNQALLLTGKLVAGSAASDVVVASLNTRSAGNIFDVKNNGADLFSINYAGLVTATSISSAGVISTVGINNSSDYHQTAGILSSDSLTSQTAVTLTLSDSVVDSASALAFLLNSTITLATPGAKLLSIKNNSVEKFSVELDGKILAPALDLAASGTLPIGGVTATEVDLGRSGQTVKILGNLDPASTAAISVFGTDVGSGTTPQVANQYLGSDGYVNLAGHMVSTSGTITAGTTLCTLASSYRPNRTVILPVVNDLGAPAYVTITAAGVLTCSIDIVIATNELPLDAIRYKAVN
jgi:hypothetical protein